MTSPEPSPSEQLFRAALAHAGPARERFVRESAAGDAELYRDVMELLRFHEMAGGDGDGLDTEVLSLAPPVPDPPAARPTHLDSATGRYTLLDVLGEGSMGIVYLAEQTSPVQRTVALKIIKLGIDSKRAAMRFASERQALALMSHPNIARVFEAGTSDDGRLYFAMEHVAGPAITEYCDSVAMPLAARLAMFVTVCHAVQHAHQRGIIHRDLKPGNVLVEAAGDRPVPKIIDFGIAKATNRRLVEHTLVTTHGLLVGSLESMSPEQAGPYRLDIDTRTDVYALGVLLYQLLVGAHPLRLDSDEGLSYAEIERRILQMDPVRPAARLRELGERARAIAAARGTTPAALERALQAELEWITSTALAKDRHRRYQSAADLAADIERFLRHEPVAAGPPGTRYRLGKFVRRNRGAVTAAAAVLLALTLGLVSTTWMYVRAREARDHILQLSDRVWLERCVAEAEDLLPPHPDRIPELERWLVGTARELIERLPEHERRLAELSRLGRSRAAGAAVGADASADTATAAIAREGGASAPVPPLQFEDRNQQFEYDLLSRLVSDLKRFEADRFGGGIACVQQRLEFARRLEHTMQDSSAAWARAIASIADPQQCPQYQGLSLRPVVGLVPIGRDPASGLWEFAHLQSGDPARRGDCGRLLIAEATGIVFVLVPGGSFFMGATPDRDALPEGATNLDPRALHSEAPVHKVHLDAFLLSKFEVTQAQWLRATGVNPSEDRPGVEGDAQYTLLHPVEGVNWFGAQRVARIWGTCLPTEAQWEYAARAGTSWPWFGGPTSAHMEHKGNSADASARERSSKDWVYDPWNDGYPRSAPVGVFEPNRFGLHDVQGNVTEWCADWECPYTEPPRAGDGMRSCASQARVARSMNWTGSSWHGRISFRISLPPTNTSRLGLRPAMRLP